MPREEPSRPARKKTRRPALGRPIEGEKKIRWPGMLPESVIGYLNSLPAGKRSKTVATAMFAYQPCASWIARNWKKNPEQQVEDVEVEETEEFGTLLTIRAVARKLRVEDETVIQWCERGAIFHIVLPQVDERERKRYRIPLKVIEEGLKTGRFARLDTPEEFVRLMTPGEL